MAASVVGAILDLGWGGLGKEVTSSVEIELWPRRS